MKAIQTDWWTRGIVIGTIAILASCGTAEPPAGHALLDASPGNTRITDPRIVSVNGQPAEGQTAILPPGPTRVRLRFNWAKGDTREVDLHFRAREDHRYFVKYDPFPPIPGDDSQPGEFLRNDPSGASFFLLPLFFTGLALRGVLEPTIDPAPAEYIDLMVIARHSPEGIVEHLRIHRDGRIRSRM